jgi:uncharacterized surface protein with fasciclin (FAS1) repeats
LASPKVFSNPHIRIKRVYSSTRSTSDKAFNKLDKQVLENLLKPEHKTKLVDLLNHHVVAGKIAFKDLKDGEKLESMNGKELHVHVKEGAVSIDGRRMVSVYFKYFK